MRQATTTLLLATALVACGADPASETLVLRGETMGTRYSVEVVAPPPALTRARAASMTAEMLARVDARMSTYRDDSELMRFNRSRSVAWFPVSPETRRVVEEALHVHGISAGAFDPTLRPLSEVWGFTGNEPDTLPPPPEVLARARERVGARHLRVRRSPPALAKDRPDLEVDLSGIAKGYGVDAIAERLASAGARNLLVEIGGELRAMGHNRRGEPWRVAIEQPSLEQRRVQSLVALRDEAIATSGSYRQFVVRGARRFGHILDPETGVPRESALVSVSVLAPTAMRADALATALFALGPERGLALAEREQLGVLFLVFDGDAVREHANASFDRRRVPTTPSRSGGMLVFVLTFLVLSAAAAGLAVGLARGRPLPGGSCREAWLAGHRLPRCEACPGSKPESPQRDPY